MCREADGLYYVMCSKYRRIVEAIRLKEWKEILDIKPCFDCRSLRLLIIEQHPFTKDMYDAIDHLSPITPALLWGMLNYARNTDTFIFLLGYTNPDMTCRNGVLLDLCLDSFNQFYPNVVEILLQFGVCIDLQDPKGDTTLHKLAIAKNYAGYNFLVECGADEDLPNRKGLSPKELLAKMTTV